MATTDSGVYKMFLYPLMIIVVLGAILELTIYPFIDNYVYPTGVSQYNVDYITQIMTNGTTIFSVDIPILGTWEPVIKSPISLLPQFMIDFIVNQIVFLATIPAWLLYPLIFIFLACFIYVLVHIIQGFIP
jgi:hypothetical protein